MKFPVDELQPEILTQLITRHRLVLSAATGSGKTTRVPGWLLPYVGGSILVLVPRRQLAREAARYVALSLNQSPGAMVGYITRDETRVSSQTRLVYATEQIFFKIWQKNPTLKGLSAIVFDEAHERGLYSDLAMGVLKTYILPERSDLFTLIMSATLAGDTFSSYWESPQINVPGTLYPIDIRYDPTGNHLHAVQTILDEYPQTVGRILCFEAGEREVRNRSFELSRAFPDIPILQFHAKTEEPEILTRLFTTPTRTELVVTTNAAECGVTIPQTIGVIDSGYHKVHRVDNRGIGGLHLERITMANATQRAGRAGRELKGMCIRLWSKEEEATMPRQLEPEIQRLPLTSAALSLYAAGVEKTFSEIQLINTPDSQKIEAAEALLLQIGALTKDSKRIYLSETGRKLAQIPLDPILARTVLAANELNCLEEVCRLIVLSKLERGTSGLFLYNPDQKSSIRKSRETFNDKLIRSDMIPSLRAFQELEHLSERLRKDFCDKYFLSKKNFDKSLSELSLLKKELNRIFQNSLNWNSNSADAIQIIKAYLAGHPSRLIVKASNNTYVLAETKEPVLVPYESVVSSQADFLIGHTIFKFQHPVRGETVKATELTQVEPEFLLEVFSDRIRVEFENYFLDPQTGHVRCDAHWIFDNQLLLKRKQVAPPGPKSGEVMALAVLSGVIDLPVLSHCRVFWAKINQVAKKYPHLGLKVDPFEFAQWMGQYLNSVGCLFDITEPIGELDLPCLFKALNCSDSTQRIYHSLSFTGSR